MSKLKFERFKINSTIADMAIKEFIPECPIELIYPNPWNPNEQDDFQYSKTLESLRKNGWVHSLVVREIWLDNVFSHFQLLDGEHRSRAAKDAGFKTAPVNNLGKLDDNKAKKLALILAANKGELNPSKLAKLVKELNTILPEEEYSELPFKADELSKLERYFDDTFVNIEVDEIFTNRREGRKLKDANNFTRVSFLFENHIKERIDIGIEKYAVEKNITANTTDLLRGKVFLDIIFSIYPELKGREEGVMDVDITLDSDTPKKLKKVNRKG